jgi:hypothetical protein
MPAADGKKSRDSRPAIGSLKVETRSNPVSFGISPRKKKSSMDLCISMAKIMPGLPGCVIQSGSKPGKQRPLVVGWSQAENEGPPF